MNLADLVDAYLEPRKANGEGEYWIRCPFCGDEQYRMGINVINGKCHCFRASCEWKSSDRRFTFKELAKVLGVEEKLVVTAATPIKAKKTHGQRHAQLPKEFETFSDLSDDVTLKAYEYLTSRGITNKQISKHKLGFCAVGDYAWRIIIPVFRKNKIISFTGRDFSGQSELRYKNHTGSKYIYNIPKTPKRKAVLLEGPFDVYAVERAVHYYDVLGRLGAGLTKRSIRDLMSYDEIVVWPDPDRGGIQLCLDTCTSLSKRGKKMFVVMPKEDDLDPGKLGETAEGLQEIQQKLKDSVKWSETIRAKLKHFAAFNTVAYGRDVRKKMHIL